MRSKNYPSIFCYSLLLLAGVALPTSAQTTAPGEWTWMDGSSTGNQPGVYGTLGTPAPGNTPGGRYGDVSWTDKSGNLWLFGGGGAPNDLWEFNPLTNEWAWMGGSSTVGPSGQPGVYGTLGTPAKGNVPGSRGYAVSWTDSSGHFWLFGGGGDDANGKSGNLNDLWEFNPSLGQFGEWTWMGGSSSVGPNYAQPGVYGSLGTPAPGNIPGSRRNASTWTDGIGNLWLFGGEGYDANGNLGYLNDLWEFNPSTNEWAWIGGSSTMTQIVNGTYGQPGAYGTLGTPSAGNIPGGRLTAASWTDSSGNLWLFGGYGFDSNGTYGILRLNDLWEFNPSTNGWAWMGGSSTGVAWQAVYGTLGAPAAGNTPGSRSAAASWTDRSGDQWLFGGAGYDADDALGFLNDLWEFNASASEWEWMGGSTTDSGFCDGDFCSQPGVYGTLGTPAPGNLPGGREYAASWTDGIGHLWLFGGWGPDANGNYGDLNDLWEYQQPTAKGLAPLITWSTSASSITTGQALTVTITVSGTGGNPTPTGSVTLNSGSFTSSATTLNSGSATFTVYAGSLAVGIDTLAASYTPDSNSSSIYNSTTSISPEVTVTAVPPASTPVFSPAGGHYSSAQTVVISDAKAGATIYYTVNGTAPTPASTPYTSPITVNNSETLEAAALAPGYSLSKAAVASYVLPTATPVFSPAAGIYSVPQTVTIIDATAGAAIYYTLNGTNPTSASTLYIGPITVSTTETIKAMAIAPGNSQSSMAAAYYGFPAAAPAISPGSGTYPTSQTVTITDSTPGAVIYYTTSGLAPVPGKVNTYVFSKPITVSVSETIEALVVAPGYGNSPVVMATYEITPAAATPVNTPAAGTYPAGQLVTLSDSTPGATIYYTTNGTAPTTSSQTYTGPFLVGATETVQAIAVANGFLNSQVSTTPYTIIGTPSALALPATAVGSPNATLNATVNSNGLAGTYLFQYGSSASALTSSTASTPLSASGLPVSASASLNGLASGTIYYYQVVVTTEGGTATGAVLSFTTN